MNQEITLTFAQLKAIVDKLEQENVQPDTKIFMDTGWDSLQEVAVDAFRVAKAIPFQIQDELTKEFYGGFVREEKKETKQVIGDPEDVIVIEHVY